MVFTRVPSHGVPNTAPAALSSVEELMAEIEKGQQLAGHFPSAEALERGRRVLVGEMSIEDARLELRAKYGV